MTIYRPICFSFFKTSDTVQHIINENSYKPTEITNWVHPQWETTQ